MCPEHVWRLFRVNISMLRTCYLDCKKLVDANCDEDIVAIL